MQWRIATRADRTAVAIADRHYNRQKPGTPQFVPPGRCLVLVAKNGGAVWVTSWPFAQYVKHDWPGAWINSCFRRERGRLASKLIRQAVAATRWYFGKPPIGGMVSFVDPKKVRDNGNPGKCYEKAGFSRVGTTKGGLIAWQMLPSEMPEAEQPFGTNYALLAGARRSKEGQ